MVRDTELCLGPATLRALRMAHELSGKDLARRAGRSQSAISQYESGAREPSRAAICALCAAMGATIAETNAALLAYQRTPTGTLIDQVHAVLAADERLSHAAREQIIQIVQNALEASGATEEHGVSSTQD